MPNKEVKKVIIDAMQQHLDTLDDSDYAAALDAILSHCGALLEAHREDHPLPDEE